jgi:TonB family protein
LVSAFGPNDQKPEIVGGMGALYHNIQYPQEARDQGIEGRLRLEFTVQADGKVRNVEVVDSLHPLCDSAAVEGIRSVRFAPAEHRGTAVPARMTLPVRFRLISVPQTADVNS